MGECQVKGCSELAERGCQDKKNKLLYFVCLPHWDQGKAEGLWVEAQSISTTPHSVTKSAGSGGS